MSGADAFLLSDTITCTVLEFIDLKKNHSMLKVTMTASTNIHDKVLQSVMKSPMSFFDANPSGRILNRFSRDLDEGK